VCLFFESQFDFGAQPFYFVSGFVEYVVRPRDFCVRMPIAALPQSSR
jgi:hypothetical protein